MREKQVQYVTHTVSQMKNTIQSNKSHDKLLFCFLTTDTN